MFFSNNYSKLIKKMDVLNKKKKKKREKKMKLWMDFKKNF